VKFTIFVPIYSGQTHKTFNFEVLSLKNYTNFAEDNSYPILFKALSILFNCFSETYVLPA